MLQADRPPPDRGRKDQGGEFLQITGACCLYWRRGDETPNGLIDPGEEPVTEEKLLRARQILLAVKKQL